MANYDTVEMDLDSDCNSGSSREERVRSRSREPAGAAPLHRQRSCTQTSPAQQRGVKTSSSSARRHLADSRARSPHHSSSRWSGHRSSEHHRSAERHRHHQSQRRHRHDADRRQRGRHEESRLRSSRHSGNRDSKRRQRRSDSEESRPRHSKSPPSADSVVTAARTTAATPATTTVSVPTSIATAVSSAASPSVPETTSVSALSCATTAAAAATSASAAAAATSAASAILSQRPDLSRVMERVDRLRRQGCMAAYQQVISGIQQSMHALLPPPVLPQPPPQLPPPTRLHTQPPPVRPLVQPNQPNIPKFYNPAAINVAKIADQERKKKLLWGNKSKSGADLADQSGSVWKPVAAFEQDDDGKVTAKFLRLMGVKNVDAAKATTVGDAGVLSDTVKRQHQMFQDMEHQYEQARVTTHTQRGCGLGYTSQYYHPKL